MTEISAQDLTGSMVALVTPMNQDNQIDYEQWEALIRWHMQSGTTAIVVAGTTGESALLAEHEFEELLRTAVQITKDHDMWVIAGTGGISPECVTHKNKMADHLGADAVLVVTPYYIRVTQDALVSHFQTIADQSPLPIITYNVPGRTGMDMETETSKQLAKHPNIIGIKEAKADMKRIQTLAKLPDFAVLSGDDDSFLEAMKNGADGVISVAANVRPQAVKAICDAMQLGDVPSAESCNQSLEKTYQLMSAEPNPGPVKSALMACHVIDCGIRKPLTTMNLSGQSYATTLAAISEEYNA